MNAFQSKKLLIPILLVAILLRFVQLGSIPPSPDGDEAAIGYNAYSILKTGKDEYGALFPAVFRSFDDYKPPLYIYLTIPSVWAFGLDTFAVRFPSALFGTLGVLGAYFLAQELLALLQAETRQRWRYLPLLAALFLAISPWHVHFSRVAFEANVGVTFNIWFVVCFLKGLKRWGWLLPAAVLASLALYVYHSERVFMPLLAAFLAVLFFKPLLRHKFRLALPILVGLLVLAPLLIVLSNPVSWKRMASTSVFSNPASLLARTTLKLQIEKASGSRLGRLLDNHWITYAQTIFEGYISHFSLNWLFFTGDYGRHHAPDMGLLYLADLPFLLLGIYACLKKRGAFAYLLFFWFLSAPIAASPSNQLPHAVRTLVFLPTFQLFTALGLIEAFHFFKAQKALLYRGFLFVLVLGYGLNVSYYLDIYFNHLNQEDSKYWEYGFAEAVDYIRQNGDQYDQIIISEKLSQPYIQVLFNLQYSPVRYLKEGGSAYGRIHFDKYYFRHIDWTTAAHDPKTLYIGLPREITGQTLEVIHYLDGSEAIKIAVK